jgi:glycosyltransferase involved in cell wall biosynthesis
MQPITVLHVIPNPFFIERGSLIRTMRQILSAHEQGMRCHVVCYHFGKDLPEATIHRTLSVPWYRNPAAGANIHRFYLDMLLMVKTFSLAKSVRPDIIHAHLHEGVFAGFPLARRMRIPLIFDAEGSLSQEMASAGFFCAGCFKPLERFLNTLPDLILTSSRQLHDRMRAEFGVAKERLILLEDCIDTVLFSPRSPNARVAGDLGIAPGAPVVVFIGSLDSINNIDTLLIIARNVAARVPQAHFLIIGFPHERSWERRFKQGGVANVHFPGMVERKSAPDFLSLGTVGISAKLSKTSQGNGKLLDYMAMGMPVVAFDIPVNRDILGPAGRLVPEGDAGRFADAVVGYLQDREAAAKAGVALRNRVCEQFSRHSEVERLIGIYRSLMAGAW